MGYKTHGNIGFKRESERREIEETKQAMKHIEECRVFSQELLNLLLQVEEPIANNIMDNIEKLLNSK